MGEGFRRMKWEGSQKSYERGYTSTTWNLGVANRVSGLAGYKDSTPNPVQQWMSLTG